MRAVEVPDTRIEPRTGIADLEASLLRMQGSRAQHSNEDNECRKGAGMTIVVLLHVDGVPGATLPGWLSRLPAPWRGAIKA